MLLFVAFLLLFQRVIRPEKKPETAASPGSARIAEVPLAREIRPTWIPATSVSDTSRNGGARPHQALHLRPDEVPVLPSALVPIHHHFVPSFSRHFLRGTLIQHSQRSLGWPTYNMTIWDRLRQKGFLLRTACRMLPVSSIRSATYAKLETSQVTRRLPNLGRSRFSRALDTLDAFLLSLLPASFDNWVIGRKCFRDSGLTPFPWAVDGCRHARPDHRRTSAPSLPKSSHLVSRPCRTREQRANLNRTSMTSSLT